VARLRQRTGGPRGGVLHRLRYVEARRALTFDGKPVSPGDRRAYVFP
jgi:hypothetical protein